MERAKFARSTQLLSVHYMYVSLPISSFCCFVHIFLNAASTGLFDWLLKFFFYWLLKFFFNSHAWNK